MNLIDYLHNTETLIIEGRDDFLPDEYNNYNFSNKVEGIFVKGDIIKHYDSSRYYVVHDVTSDTSDGFDNSDLLTYHFMFEYSPNTDLYKDDADLFDHIDSFDIINKIKLINKVVYWFNNNGLIRINGEYYYSNTDFTYDNIYDLIIANVSNPDSVFYLNETNLHLIEFPTIEDINGLLSEYQQKLDRGYEIFKEMASIADKVYPGFSDSYDFHDGISGQYREIIIHFPKFDISNHSNSHTINDLFMKIDINEFGLINNNLRGLRSSQTIEEHDSHYTHSHLSTNQLGNWGGFCLGATDLSVVTADLSREYNPLLFEALLYRLKDYVTWESISGGPYRKISSIRLNGSSNSDGYQIDDKKCQMILKELDKLPLLTKKNKFYNSVFVDKDKDEFELTISSIAEKLNFSSRYTIRKDIINNVYVGNSSEIPAQLRDRIYNLNSQPEFNNTLFVFRGDNIKRKIITKINITESTYVRVLNKKSYKYLCDHIDEKLYEYLNYKEILNNGNKKRRKQSIA